jgi:hypothetical protein
MFQYVSRETDGSLLATTSGSITSTHNGYNYVGLRLKLSAAVSGGSDIFINGIRCTSGGDVLYTNGVGVNESQGYRVTADGRLCVNTGAVGAGTYNNGWFSDADGRIYADIT